MIVRLADIFVDPVIGGAMDRTRSPLGRYKPWLIIGAPLIMLGMAALFMARPGVGPAWLASWLVVVYAGWSIVSLAQLALGAQLSSSYDERSRVYTWWQTAFFVGMIIVLGLPKALEASGNGNIGEGMRAIAWSVIAVLPICVFLAIRYVPSQSSAGAASKGGEGMREYFLLLRRPIVRRLLAIELQLGIAAGTIGTLALFFFTRVKELPAADVGILFIIQSLFGLVSTSLWKPLSMRIGKHIALCAAAVMQMAVTGMLLAVPSGSLLLAALVFGASGVTFGAITLLPRAMMADIGDEEKLQTGADRTGLLYALMIGTWKIGQAISVGGTFVLLDYVGFSADASAHNSETAMMWLKFLTVGFPAILCGGAAWAAFGYPLTAKRHGEIIAQLTGANGHHDMDRSLE